MWRGVALLALAAVSSAQEFGPCPAPPDVALTVRPVSRELSAPAPEVSLLLTGSIVQDPSCALVGGTVQIKTSPGAGFAAPVAAPGGKFSETVTIPLPPPPRRGPTVLRLFATAVNQAGTGYSEPVVIILPRRP